jgi:hypothetical protein
MKTDQLTRMNTAAIARVTNDVRSRKIALNRAQPRVTASRIAQNTSERTIRHETISTAELGARDANSRGRNPQSR